MTHKKDMVKLDDLLEKLDYMKEDKDKIVKAYQYALEKHDGQFRKSGEPYIIHPLNVAIILTSVYADSDSIIAALLHDVVEDTDATLDEVEEMFGPVVRKLVDGVTKLGRIHFSTDNEYLTKYYKKLIVGMREDLRVIKIKLAD